MRFFWFLMATTMNLLVFKPFEYAGASDFKGFSDILKPPLKGILKHFLVLRIKRQSLEILHGNHLDSNL